MTNEKVPSFTNYERNGHQKQNKISLHIPEDGWLSQKSQKIASADG